MRRCWAVDAFMGMFYQAPIWSHAPPAGRQRLLNRGTLPSTLLERVLPAVGDRPSGIRRTGLPVSAARASAE